MIHEPPFDNEDTRRVKALKVKGRGVMARLHNEIERHRHIVNLCDELLAMKALFFAHWFVRWARKSSEAEIKSLKSISSAIQLAWTLEEYR